MKEDVAAAELDPSNESRALTRPESPSSLRTVPVGGRTRRASAFAWLRPTWSAVNDYWSRPLTPLSQSRPLPLGVPVGLHPADGAHVNTLLGRRCQATFTCGSRSRCERPRVNAATRSETDALDCDGAVRRHGCQRSSGPLTISPLRFAGCRTDCTIAKRSKAAAGCPRLATGGPSSRRQL